MKDFAFQFLPGDYLRDTQCLSEKAQVAYDRIMCEHVRSICLDMQGVCLAKDRIDFFLKRLSEDEKWEIMSVLNPVSGGFQIEWVARKVAERAAFLASRQKNAASPRSPKRKKKHEKAYAKHLDKDNNNVNNDLGKEGMGEKPFDETLQSSPIRQNSSLRRFRDVDFDSLPRDCNDDQSRERLYDAIGIHLYMLEEMSIDFGNAKVRALFPWLNHLMQNGRPTNTNSMKELIKRTDAARLEWIERSVSTSVSNDYAGLIPFEPDKKSRDSKQQNEILTRAEKQVVADVLDGKIQVQ